MAMVKSSSPTKRPIIHRCNLALILVTSLATLVVGAAAASSSSPPKKTTAVSSMSETIESYQHAVFSDVDGTLVHYPKHLQKKKIVDNGHEATSNNDDKEHEGDGLIYLPPSKTGTRGVISSRTLQLCHRLRHGSSSVKEGSSSPIAGSSREERIRNGGVPFVLVSGMRTTTLFQRLPYLPRADAYVSESGGRIFYPRPILSEHSGDVEGLVEGLEVQSVLYPGMSSQEAEPFALVEDMEWRRRISQLTAAGSDGYNNETPMGQRQGTLWEFARALEKRGYVLDNSGYATAFRINRKLQNADLTATFDGFLAECANREGIPDGLGCSTNLGCVDVYPAMSGKRNCAEYLVKRFLQTEDGEAKSRSISLKRHAVCMCDDDNDVEMALACRAAYLPSVTSESMRNLVNSPNPGGRLVLTEDASKGIVETLATEAALVTIIEGELR